MYKKYKAYGKRNRGAIYTTLSYCILLFYSILPFYSCINRLRDNSRSFVFTFILTAQCRAPESTVWSLVVLIAAPHSFNNPIHLVVHYLSSDWWSMQPPGGERTNLSPFYSKWKPLIIPLMIVDDCEIAEISEKAVRGTKTN